MSISMTASKLPKLPHNKLQSIQSLHNKYYALRHGQSLANVAGIISSDPAISTVQHGLSDIGKEQVSSSALKFTQNFLAGNHHRIAGAPSPSWEDMYSGVAIYSSDFTRARETADIFSNALQKAGIPLFHSKTTSEDDDDADEDNRAIAVNGVKHETRLRERFFGDFNGKSDAHYQDVWDVDRVNADHTEFGCESVNSVMSRTTELILDMDDELKQAAAAAGDDTKPHKVILVAHGDVLQILQTAFLKKDGSVHRSMEHLETATVRGLLLP